MQVGRWVHDFACHPEGARKLRGGGLYRPPSNETLLVHNLKRGGFHVAWDLMKPDPPAYDHAKCKADGMPTPPRPSRAKPPKAKTVVFHRP